MVIYIYTYRKALVQYEKTAPITRSAKRHRYPYDYYGTQQTFYYERHDRVPPAHELWSNGLSALFYGVRNGTLLLLVPYVWKNYCFRLTADPQAISLLQWKIHTAPLLTACAGIYHDFMCQSSVKYTIHGHFRSITWFYCKQKTCCHYHKCSFSARAFSWLHQ